MIGSMPQQVLAIPFRLDDLSIVLIISTIVIGCAAHFIREILLGRRGQRWNMVLEKVMRYDKVQIVVHWLFLIFLTTLFVTGFIIFKMEYLFSLYPQLGVVGLRNWVAYHWYFAIVVIGLGIFHILYDTVIISKFNDAWITRLDLRNMKVIINNFFRLTTEYPNLEKLHPLQKMFHWSICAVLFLLGFTGLTIWEPFLGFIKASGLGYFEEWLYIYNSRYLHDLFTFILVALMIGHFYFSALIPTNWRVFRGMTRGWIKIDSSNKLETSRLAENRSQRPKESQIHTGSSENREIPQSRKNTKHRRNT
jgi:cytochrome b subunit of formate dehydrogenase